MILRLPIAEHILIIVDMLSYSRASRETKEEMAELVTMDLWYELLIFKLLPLFLVLIFQSHYTVIPDQVFVNFCKYDSSSF